MPVETPQTLLEARERVASLTERRSRLIATPAGRGRWKEIANIDADIAELLDGIRNRIDPCDASPDVPLVLLPVRVEAKLTPGTTILRVRITPDEVHIDSLLRSMTETEGAAGRTYWKTLWEAPDDLDAWSTLVAAVGARRAGWITQATTPTNVDERGTGSPVFPETPAEIAHGTVARCLPDQFIVRVFLSGQNPLTAVGKPIARDVPISPIALGDTDVLETDSLLVPAGSEWTVNYEKARDAGLGVDVTLPSGTRVLDRVVVVGTRRSVSEEENAADFSELLTSHRFTDGVSLLPSGTPSNNAEAERSPYRPNATAGAPPTTTPEPSADAQSLSALLGLDPVVLEGLLEADAPRSSLGSAQRAANTALWFATWEYVLNLVDETAIEAVTPATIESARRLHRDHVRGAGHAPIVRVGAQPYGVLPVADLANWAPLRGELNSTLVPLVQRTLRRWTERSASLPHVSPGDSVSDEALLDMMGTSPVSTAVRARPAVDGPKIETLGGATGAGKAQIFAELQVTRAVLAQYSIEAAQRLLPPSVHDESRMLALPYVSDRDAEVIEDILADRAPQVDSVLQALLDVAWDEAKASGGRAAPGPFVSPLLEFLAVDPDVSALVKLAQTERAGAAQDPEKVFAAAEKVRSTIHFDGQPTEQVSLSSIEPIAEARTSLAQIALDLGDTVEARWIGQNALAGLLDAFAVRGEVGQAMRALGSVPIDERRIAVASALDIASHRVDAWATALAHSRMSAGTGAMSIGAFGYLEGVRLGTADRKAEGWLHAPSSSHASAAGILSSAHRSNIGAKAGAQPFAIELTSRRGTELRRVLEGVHAGQSIGALLGYQIERSLTGSSARFQLSLRELAPLTTDELNNDLAEADRSTRVAAADVVDGVSLLRQFPLETIGNANPPLRTRLATRPKNAYIETWGPVSDAEWDAVEAALRGAAATLDAVSDALLSESVLQYATGNAARASAAMDAMAMGGSVDADLGVLGVRQSGQKLTHGLIAVIPAGATGWSSTRPRAIAEPRLEAWAARRLGDPAKIIVTDAGSRHTLAESGFAALDLVFADDVAGLDRDLRSAIPAMGDAPLAAVAATDWPEDAIPIVLAATLAGTLRTIAAGAAPLEPDALVRPGEPTQRLVDTDELLGRCDALLDALDDTVRSGHDVITAIDPESFAVEETDVAAVSAAVAGLAAFGVPLVPDPAIPSNAGWAWGAWHAASARLDSARATLADIRAPHTPPRSTGEILDAATTVAEGVLGDGFRLMPLLTPAAGADDFADAEGNPLFDQPPRSAVNAFVRDHATVRAGVARFAEAQLLGSAIGHPIPLAVVQLTEREGGTPAPGTERWLAGALPEDVPWPAHSAAHLVVERLGDDVSGPVAGISIDGWIETLPFQPDPRAFEEGADPANPLRGARATTGLAVHANQASAHAPQVFLSAVSPDGKRWTTDKVVNAVLAAVDLAKARLVTYEKVPGDAAILPAIYVSSPWLQPRKGFSFEELAKVKWDSVPYPFLSEVK